MKAFLKTIDNLIFTPLQESYARILEKECEDCDSLLDVGCGSDSPIRYFSQNPKYSVGVDGFQPSIDESKAAGIHDEYACMNVLDIAGRFGARSFDCVIASDVVEHLEKEDGHRLIQMMETIAARKVIIFTPNGFLVQHGYDGNSYQEHLSGWTVEEMRKLGYRVTGVHGWKPLRGEFARIKYRPEAFWWRMSLLSQRWTDNNPRYAFAILCVKQI